MEKFSNEQNNINYNKRNFQIQTDHLTSAKRPDLIIFNKKGINSRIVDFTVPADHKIKLKESEEKDKYLDFAREL